MSTEFDSQTRLILQVAANRHLQLRPERRSRLTSVLDFKDARRMLTRVLPGLAIGVALLVGCSSTPTRVDKGPIKASSYSLLASKDPAGKGWDERRKEVHGLIQDAIAVDLERKGVRQVASGGDIQVGYLVVVMNNSGTVRYDEYFGYGGDAAAVAAKAHKERGRISSRDYFQVGALVIDVIDPLTSKVLFRSHAEVSVQSITPENRAERIQALVGSCLEGVRIRR